MSGDWSPISSAPCDGTPVILWLNKDAVVPILPVTVGYWVTNDHLKVAGYWSIFGDQDDRKAYVDRHIRGWKPLLRDRNA